MRRLHYFAFRYFYLRLIINKQHQSCSHFYAVMKKLCNKQIPIEKGSALYICSTHNIRLGYCAGCTAEREREGRKRERREVLHPLSAHAVVHFRACFEPSLTLSLRASNTHLQWTPVNSELAVSYAEEKRMRRQFVIA